MKKKSKSNLKDDLKPEYDLGRLLRKGVRGKYAKRFRSGTNIVLLDPDVAKVFPTDEAVNETLRLAIELTRFQSRRKHTAVKT
jgi:hypothetical protein